MIGNKAKYGGAIYWGSPNANFLSVGDIYKRNIAQDGGAIYIKPNSKNFVF